MAKALLVRHVPAAAPSGNFGTTFGGVGGTSTEAQAQYSCTEGATFSNLYFNIQSGGNATNNVRFRDTGADGNLFATRSNVGSASDAVNTDTLAAADTFNFAFTDTGTDPVYSVIRANVEFASGYGSFFASTGLSGIVFDAPSATRFIPIAGNLGADGNTTEAAAAWLCHGASVFSAFQVYVSANARTNDVVIKNRINGADGSGTITITAGQTGLFTATGLSDTINDGDEVCLSITLLTGVEDLTMTFAGATLKDSGNEMEMWCAIGAGEARAASATPSYYCIGGRLEASASEANKSVTPGFALTARNLRIYISANTYSTDATLILRQAGATAITTTIGAGVTGWIDPASGTAAVLATDLIDYEIVGGTTGSITPHMIGFTYAPDGVAASSTSLNLLLLGVG